MSTSLPEWVRAWRVGLAPQFSSDELRILQRALREDALDLIQGQTSVPDADPEHDHEPVCTACALCYPVWKTAPGGLMLAGELASAFARIVHEANRRMGYDNALRPFFIFWDESQRSVAREALLKEVNIALCGRFAGAGSAARHDIA